MVLCVLCHASVAAVIASVIALCMLLHASVAVASVTEFVTALCMLRHASVAVAAVTEFVTALCMLRHASVSMIHPSTNPIPVVAKSAMELCVLYHMRVAMNRRH